nr:MAG TPA: hypothetical protein [Bacteriophage sp.]
MNFLFDFVIFRSISSFIYIVFIVFCLNKAI